MKFGERLPLLMDLDERLDPLQKRRRREIRGSRVHTVRFGMFPADEQGEWILRRSSPLSTQEDSRTGGGGDEKGKGEGGRSMESVRKEAVGTQSERKERERANANLV